MADALHLDSLSKTAKQYDEEIKALEQEYNNKKNYNDKEAADEVKVKIEAVKKRQKLVKQLEDKVDKDNRKKKADELRKDLEDIGLKGKALKEAMEAGMGAEAYAA